MKKKKISELDSYSGNSSTFVIVGVDTTTGVTKKANFAALIGDSGDPRIKTMTAARLTSGCMLFYDKAKDEYCVVAASNIASVLANYSTARYSTNYDTYIGTQGGKAHFVGINDAYGTGFYASDVAATSCFYRIIIDNEVDGYIKFTATSGNATLTDQVVEWNAGEEIDNIVTMFKDLNTTNITFDALADGTGVGLEIGGYGANTFVLDEGSEGATVVDMTHYAMLASSNPGVNVGDTFVPGKGYVYISTSAHKNWCGSTALSILGGSIVGADSSCLSNSGYNYSYRTGLNFAKWKTYATSSGSSTFTSDGVNGSTASSTGVVMSKATFDANVNTSATAGSNAAKMYEYYNHLFTDNTGDYAALRTTYTARYGMMNDLYDAYLMSHMMDVAANSTITNSMRNKGDAQTAAKADALNITYDYVIIPAYPPEYNAKQYGNNAKDGFIKGTYYHPEPSDLGLMFRDDIMALINSNITTVNSVVAAGTGLALTNSINRGSCADCGAGGSWYFAGTGGCFTYDTRYSWCFRSRPVLALALPN